MATTKIKSIHTTLYYALSYIMNLEKTDFAKYVFQYGCFGDAATATLKMEDTISFAHGNGSILAQHIMQSFAHGEVTPDEAHEIGRKFADEFLGGKYKFTLATHIDKEHIHNHIIFCNYETVNKKSFEYTRNRNKKAWREMRNVSDKICREYGKSVIENSRDGSRKSTVNYVKHNGIPIKESYRRKLMIMIDSVIYKSKSFEEFLENMRSQGVVCEYMPENKITLKFKMPEAKKFNRAGGLGFDYDEKGIRRRINDSILFRTGESTKPHKTFLIDTSTERMKNSPYLRQWAEIRNMQEVSERLNLLTAKRKYSEDDGAEIADQINAINAQIESLTSAIYNLDKVDFPNTDSLKKQLEGLKSDKKDLNKKYKEVKNELLKLDTARKEVQEYLNRNYSTDKSAKRPRPERESPDRDDVGR